MAEYWSMTEAMQLANPMIDDYLKGKAMAINVPNQTVMAQLNSLLEGMWEGCPPAMELSYDHLIVSVSCQVLNDKGMPGAKKAL
jgi:hypothetical protein